jgi:uncharacterized protein with HEPN domain
MRRERLLLTEIVEAAERIVELAGGLTAESLDADRTRREALLWSFTVLGEACAQVDADFRADHPQVPWHEARDLRNRIVHGYWQVSTGILVATAQDDIPGLLEAARVVLETLAEST